MLSKLLIIGLGGFLGAIARYLASGWAQRLTPGAYPVGTLLVNALGCLLIGAAMGALEDRGGLPPMIRLGAVTGFLGAFTTFSTFGYETIELVRDGQWPAAGLNVLANCAVGFGAVIVGRGLIRGWT